ncbi:hypothetical protein [Halopseudomonas laoshanensis]|uniref:hypothetical protein n=1 Tax=Halopseudomonas laoshanensis TaxID=2268758 RepID=UPI0037363797
MATHNSDAIDTTILVLHPSSAPHVVNAGGALEFQEEAELILPAQKQLKNSLVRALNKLADARKVDDVTVEWRLRVDPETGVEFPATYVVRLAGPNIKTTDVEDFRAAAQLILGKLVPQRALGELDPEPTLRSADLELIQPLAQEFASQFANRSITQGVMIRFGSAELDGVTVQGVMPTLIIEHNALEILSGVAKPMGFDESQDSAILLVIPKTDQDESSQIQGRTKFLCHNPDFLKTLATAYVGRRLLEFEAVRQRDARSQKTILTLRSLKEVPPSQTHDSFELQ